MMIRHEIRLTILMLAILAGLALEQSGERDLAMRCPSCVEAVETG